MNIYNKDFELFIKTIQNTTDDIQLMNYDNEKEKELIKMMINDYKNTNSLSILEELYRLCECEVIFDKIWAIERNVVFKKVHDFKLDSVCGVSFLHEFIKQIQLGKIEYFNQLYMICTIKYFKTLKAASEYFDAFIQNVKDIPHVDLTSTLKQRDRFIQIFKDYEQYKK